MVRAPPPRVPVPSEAGKGRGRQPRAALARVLSRLRRRTDFLRVQKSKIRVTSRHFVFLLAPGIDPEHDHVGITVSRKVGCAVVRNRAKRLVREALRQLPGFVPRGIDMIVLVRAPLTGLKTPQVVSEWQGVTSHVAHRAQAMAAPAHAPNGDRS